MSSTPDGHPDLPHLPVGERPQFDPDGMPGWEIFPFEHDGLTAKVLDPPVFPEPPRNGEDGPDDCHVCTNPDRQVVWRDEHWALRHQAGPSAVPVILQLCPIGHHDLEDLPDHLAAELGPVLMRVERAVATLPGVGRVHVHKWGDGGAHLHVFFFARPSGLQQLRGSCLVVWDDILPRLDAEVWRANLATVAEHMARDGGEAVLG